MMEYMTITEEDLEKKFKLWKILHPNLTNGCNYCKVPSCVHVPYIPIFTKVNSMNIFDKFKVCLSHNKTSVDGVTVKCYKFLIPSNYKKDV